MLRQWRQKAGRNSEEKVMGYMLSEMEDIRPAIDIRVVFAIIEIDQRFVA